MQPGRVTFSEWAEYRPASTGEPFASWINSTQKYVAPGTLDSADQWLNSTLIEGPVADFVTELRQQDGGTIGTAGSPSLVRSLIDQGMLDELTLIDQLGRRRRPKAAVRRRLARRSSSTLSKHSQPAVAH